MRDLLQDLYNKVLTFFQSDRDDEDERSKETAKNRLKLVLMQDRSNLEPETMAKLRGELIEVISRYIVIDKEALGLNIDGNGESLALMLNIPVIRAKTTEEIATEEKLRNALSEKSENDDSKEIEEVEEDLSSEEKDSANNSANLNEVDDKEEPLNTLSDEVDDDKYIEPLDIDTENNEQELDPEENPFKTSMKVKNKKNN